MPFDLKLSLSVSLRPSGSHKGELTMGEWADDAFDRLKNHEGNEHAENQRQAELRHQIMANAPFLWGKLAGAIAEEIKNFHDLRPDYLKIFDHSRGDDAFIEVSSPTRLIQIAFNQPSPRITYVVTEERGPTARKETVAEGSFSFLVKSGEVWLFEKGEPNSVPDAMTKILNYIA